MQTQAKVWDQAAVHELLDRSAAAVAAAVLKIYARQTAAEKAQGETVEHNGRGFSGRDARFLSNIAVKLPRYGNRMTPAQLARVRPLMKRYWRQLLEEIEAKGQPVNYGRKARKAETTIAAPRPVDVEPPADVEALADMAIVVDDGYAAELQARHRKPDPALVGAF